MALQPEQKRGVNINLRRALRSSALVSLLSPTILMGYVPRAKANCYTSGSDPYAPTTGDSVYCTSTVYNSITVSGGNNGVDIQVYNAYSTGYLISVGGDHNNLTLNNATFDSNQIHLTGAGYHTAIITNGYITSAIHAINVESAQNIITLNENTSINVTSGSRHGMRLNYADGTNITLNDSSSISTSGTRAHGIDLYQSTDNVITLNDSTQITTNNTTATGIVLSQQSNDNTIVLNDSSKIVTTGTRSDAINLEGTSNGNGIYLYDTSYIRTSAVDSDGIELYESYNNTIKLNNNSYIITNGTNAHGIFLRQYSANNSITLNNNGYILTQNDASHGINMELASDNTVTLNGGKINATGIHSFGINSSANYAISGSNTITLNSGSRVTGEQAIHGAGYSKVRIFLDGTSSAVNLVGTGGTAIGLGDYSDYLNITGDVRINGNVDGGEAYDVANILILDSANLRLLNYSNVTNFGNIKMYGDNTIRSTGGISGNIRTVNGYDHASLRLRDYAHVTSTNGPAVYIGYGDYNSASLSDDSYIYTNGSGAHGVEAYYTDSTTTTISDDSRINIAGNNSAAIYGHYSYNNTFTLYNNGSIYNSGNSGYGISMRTSTGVITLNDSSEINTNGTQTYGIRLNNVDTSSITLNNDSVIQTDGYDSSAIQIDNASVHNTITLNDTSSVITTDYYSDAILINDSGYNSLTLNDSSLINTTENYSNSVSFVNSYLSDIILNDTSRISTAANYSHGIAFNGSTNNTITMNDSSSILLGGVDNAGIDISGSSENNTITLNDGAAISTNGVNSKGIRITNSDNNEIELNDASYIVSNNNNSAGVVFDSGADHNTLLLSGSSSINTSGNNAIGVLVTSSNYNSVELDDDSFIYTVGSYSHGIAFDDTNDSTLTLSKGTVAADGANANAINITSSSVTQNNILIEAGSSIRGHYGIYASDNSRLIVTLDGSNDDVAVTGDDGTAIQFGKQNDTFTLLGDVTIDGVVRGNSGTDTLDFTDVTLDLVGSSVIDSFEVLNLHGDNIVNGDMNLTGVTINTFTNSSLHVNGDFTVDSITVGNGAEFGGNNNLTGDVIIGSGGTIAPGNSIGTINITGDLTFLTGSVFEAEVSGATADQVNVDGNITIQSGVTLDIIPLSAFSGSADILTATGTITGTFGTVNYNGVTVSVLYSPSAVSLSTSVLSVLTYNPSAANANMMSSLGSGLLFSDTVAEQSAEGAFEKGKYQWARALYRHTDHDAQGGYSGSTDNMYGAAYGSEYDFNENWRFGFSLADIADHTGVKSETSETRSNGAFASLYATRVGELKGTDVFATFALTGGYKQNDNKRMVNNSGTFSNAISDSSDIQMGGIFQLGARKDLSDSWQITPKFSVAYIRTEAGGYAEKNGGAAGVVIEDHSFDTLKTTEGFSLQNKKGYTLSDSIIVRPRLDLSISQEQAISGRKVRGVFSDTTNFQTSLSEQGGNFVNTGVGLDFDVTDSIAAFINYQNAYSSDENRKDAKVGVNIKF